MRIVLVAFLFAVAPLDALAGGSCEGDTTIAVVGWNPASKELLVESTTVMVQNDGSEMVDYASLTAIGIASATARRQIFGVTPTSAPTDPKLVEKLRAETAQQMTKGFQPMKPIEVAAAPVQNPKQDIEEVSFADPLRSGAFVVSRVIGTAKTTRIDLLYREAGKKDVVLQKDFVSRHQANVLGLTMPAKLLFWETYAIVPLRYCATPVVFTYVLSTSRAGAPPR
jgi:hypothetical protein